MDGFEQLHERAFAIDLVEFVAAVKVHDLPEQRDFFHAALHQSAHLLHDFRNGPRAFHAARGGNDAERAVHVAALHDRDEGRGLPLAQRVLANFVLRIRLLAGIDDGEALVVDERLQPAAQKLVHVVGHAMKFLRSHDEIDRHGRLRELRPAALRHAAKIAKNQMRAHPPQFLEHAILPMAFCSAHVAHAAGIEQDDVGIRLVAREPIASRRQRLRDVIGVALVHLAAVGLDVNGRLAGQGAGHWQTDTLHGTPLDIQWSSFAEKTACSAAM